MVAFTLRISEEVNDKLELIAFLEKTSKTEIIRDALETHLAQYKNVKDPRK